MCLGVTVLPVRSSSPLHSTPLLPMSVSTFKLANLMSCTLCFRPTHAQAIVIWSLAVKLVCNIAHVRGRWRSGQGQGKWQWQWAERDRIRLGKQVTWVTRAPFLAIPLDFHFHLPLECPMRSACTWKGFAKMPLCLCTARCLRSLG